MKIANKLNTLTTFTKKALPQMNKEQLNRSLFFVYILFSNYFNFVHEISLWPSDSVAGLHIMYILLLRTVVCNRVVAVFITIIIHH